MESIFEEVKEKQEAADKAFEEEQSLVVPSDKKVSKSRKRTLLGSNVKIVSGDFVDFSGTVKKLDKKRGLVCIPYLIGHFKR